MKISKESLNQIKPKINVDVPKNATFGLPEKVLQFGTGVLLRGLPDYFIDKANKKDLFNGRIVVVKSTDHGSIAPFDNQDGMYTLNLVGVKEGEDINEVILNNAISRVVKAQSDWQEILKCAHDENMQIVISNTTEVGIRPSDDNIHDDPPSSFPGKLLSFLDERYKAFGGDPNKGMTVVPTELIDNNGEELKQILIELSRKNGLSDKFISWLTNCNYFCNSLVDRIVPGKLSPEAQSEKERQLGYEDDLMITAEPYGLWAIEYPDEKVKESLSFSSVHEGVILSKDIDKQRELKLRLLNGAHTFSCALAFLEGFETVKDAMQDKEMSTFIEKLMIEEIAPLLTKDDLSIDEAHEFAKKVLDRFRNPHIIHKWLDICTQITSKMKMRNVPLLLSHYEKTDRPPKRMAKGFAAYISFIRSSKDNEVGFYGINDKKDEMKYPINDDKAGILHERWRKYPDNPVEPILADTRLWGTDLSRLSGFAREVESNMKT